MLYVVEFFVSQEKNGRVNSCSTLPLRFVLLLRLLLAFAAPLRCVAGFVGAGFLLRCSDVL
jgi:hypothetical protein